MGFIDVFGKNKQMKQEKQEAESEREFVRSENMMNHAFQDDNSFFQFQQAKSDLTRWQQDLDNTIDELKYNLMNYVHTDDGWKPDTVVGRDQEGNLVHVPLPPMLNKYGTYKMISIVKQYLNRNTMMSNLQEEQILRMLRRLNEKLVIHLGMSFDIYEIDKRDLPIIKKLILDSVEVTLYRAWNNGERKYLNTINKRVEAYADKPKELKKGLFGNIAI